MDYYLYFSPDFETEYFVEKVKKSKIIEIYDEIKKYLQPWVGRELIPLDDILTSNKIVISYPIFDYNRVTIDDYPLDLSEHMNYALNYCEWTDDKYFHKLKEYLKTNDSLMHCYINGEAYNADNKIKNAIDNLLKAKLPEMKTGNICIDIKLHTVKEDDDLANYNQITIKDIEDNYFINCEKSFSQLFIMEVEKEYIPFIVKDKNEIVCIGGIFNDLSLLKDLINDTYKDIPTDIKVLKKLEHSFIEVNQLKLINISKNQYPKYVYVPVKNDEHFVNLYGCIDNEYFPSKSMAILYASRFNNIEIIDDSVIPYINNGQPFDVKSVGFDMLAQIQNIDKMYEDMKHKQNTINSIDNHGKVISTSIDKVANANTKIAEDISSEMHLLSEVVDHGLYNVADSNITAAEIGRGLHMLA